MTTTTFESPVRETTVRGGVGDDALRPDGTLKVTGEFAYSSDLWAENMLWGATLRSPHPRARIHGVDLTGRAGDARRLRRTDARGRTRCEALRSRVFPTNPYSP